MHPPSSFPKKRSKPQAAHKSKLLRTCTYHYSKKKKNKEIKKKRKCSETARGAIGFRERNGVQGTSSNAASRNRVIASRHFRDTGRITARFSISSLSLRGLPLRGPRAYRTIPSPVASPRPLLHSLT